METQQQAQRDLENSCIQEHAPWCSASCPVHVDVRAMAAAISQQDFAGALKILRKSVPFPGIISHLCDQPCQKACKRVEAGGAIEIASLERACVEFGVDPKEKIKLLPRKSKRVAVVGGGLSGLTVAYDLARKGYGVTLYEANSQLGGSLWNEAQDRLPFQVILSDLAVLDQLGVEILLDTPVGKLETNGRRPPLTLLCEQFDAVYLGIGQDGTRNLRDISDLQMDANGNVMVDPVTFMTSQDGIFAGGSMLSGFDPRTLLPEQPPGRAENEMPEPPRSDAGEPISKSPVEKISDGRRAATSIERYFQKVSLTASRMKEGSYETRLFTSLAGIQPEPPVEPQTPSSGYSQKEAAQEAGRCLQCECLECVKVCEYLRHYGSYPKKYLREIYNNLSIVMGMRNSNQFINSCSLCGLCGEVCPTDLNMAPAIQTARQTMVTQKRMPPSAHDFALKDLAFSTGEQFSFARHAPQASSSLYAFFPGCQLCASSPHQVEALYERMLARPQTDTQPVGLMLHCCGAPADWAGRTDLFQQSQASFYAGYEALGRPTLILACSSCYRAFQDHYPEVNIISLWEWLEQEDLLPASSPAREIPPLAIHDACATRHQPHLHESVRRILDKLGIPFEELPLNRENTECCSYGGMMWLANPALAHQVVDRRIQASPQDYLTYCAMCRDFFARQGKPALHLLDLIFGSDPTAAARRPDPGFSLRRENRRYLKRKLLRHFWGEMMEPLPEFSNILLIYSEQVQELLEQRLILQEDLQRVIEHAESTGQKMLNKKSGHFLAYYQPQNVTYWVEYSPSPEAESDGLAFVIHNAYSHRMVIEGESER